MLHRMSWKVVRGYVLTFKKLDNGIREVRIRDS